MAGESTAVPPQTRSFVTPTHKYANAEVNRIFKRLAATGLEFDTSELPRSPSRTPTSPANYVQNLIRFLYFQDRDKLSAIIDSYVSRSWSDDDNHSHRLQTLRTDLRIARQSVSPAVHARSFSDRLEAVYTNEQVQVVKGLRSDEPTGDAVLLSSPHDNGIRSGRSDLFQTFSSDTVGSQTSSSSFDQSGLDTGISTAATSFQEQPVLLASQAPSSYGSQFGSEEEETLLRLGIDEHQGSTSDPGFSKDQANVNDRLYRHALEPTAVDSPQQIPSPDFVETVPTSYLLRDMPFERLVTFELPKQVESLPFLEQWLLLRACNNDEERSSHLHALADSEHSSGVIKERAKSWIREMFTEQEVASQARRPFRGALTVQSHRKRRAMLQFNPRESSDDALSRLEKHFGPERFLTVAFTYPEWRILNDLGKTAEQDFKTALRTFLKQDQLIFGRWFKCFHVENVGRTDNILQFRFRYFAVIGSGILSTIDLPDLIEWALATSSNLSSPYCKLWARMDLSLSRTMSTIVFSPHQIKLRETGSTIFGDNTPESTEFNDGSLSFNRDEPVAAVVMNDGCSQISVAAARRICEMLRLDAPWPTVFQGRINGAKGLWSIDGSYDDQSKDIWISINDSQLKIQPRPEDLSTDTCENGRWTFELVSHSMMPAPSCLFLDFIPIMENRGVPRDIIIDVIGQEIKLEFEGFLESLHSMQSLRQWLEINFPGELLRNREFGVPFAAGFPKDELEKVVLMIESGFDVGQSRLLARSLMTTLRLWVRYMLERLKIRCEQSVMPLGIADPLGCLAPGHISLHFSQPVSGVYVGTTQCYLECEVLVARLPALRGSDIQRVRAVYKPELKHLKNVVVFPSRGSIPLASKLQGGDYDGDKFWVCWDPQLVNQFKNAPSSVISKPLRHYGIRQDKRTVQQIVDGRDDEAHGLIRLMNEATNFAFEDKMLGKVTIAHKRLAYKRRSLIDPDVEELADIHDLIIDAKKNGYRWTQDDFRSLMKRIKEPVVLPEPAYETALKLQSSNEGHIRDKCRHRKEHILDTLVFDHVMPQAEKFLADVSEVLQIKGGDHEDLKEPVDDVLSGPYRRFADMENLSPADREKYRHLTDSIKATFEDWTRRSQSIQDDDPARFEAFLEALEGTYLLFRDIQPNPSDAPSKKDESATNIAENDRRSGMDCVKRLYPDWDLLKASALYAHSAERQRRGFKFKLAFWLAGRELCCLKTESLPRSRGLTEESYNILRPRKRAKIMQHGRFINPRRGGQEDGIEWQ